MIIKEELLRFIIERIIDSAIESREELKSNKCDFNDGKNLAYYEVLSIIKSELSVHEIDLKKYGLDINLEEKLI